MLAETRFLLGWYARMARIPEAFLQIQKEGTRRRGLSLFGEARIEGIKAEERPRGMSLQSEQLGSKRRRLGGLTG
jgi:hypothetical protein